MRDTTVLFSSARKVRPICVATGVLAPLVAPYQGVAGGLMVQVLFQNEGQGKRSAEELHTPPEQLAACQAAR